MSRKFKGSLLVLTKSELSPAMNFTRSAQRSSGIRCDHCHQGIKGFVIPTKSFVKLGTAKIFCYNKMFGCCSKISGCSNKKLFVVSNFVAVTKPFISVMTSK